MRFECARVANAAGLKERLGCAPIRSIGGPWTRLSSRNFEDNQARLQLFALACAAVMAAASPSVAIALGEEHDVLGQMGYPGEEVLVGVN